MDYKDIVLTKKDQLKIFNMAKGFAAECEKKGINAEDTEEMVVEVMRATASTIIEDRMKALNSK